MIRKDVAEAQGRHAPWLDPLLLERIDRVLAILQDGGPQALRQKPRVFASSVSDDETIVGADFVRVNAVVPFTIVQQLEILDATGNVLGTSSRFDAEKRNSTWAWDAKDPDNGIAIVHVRVYVAPSIYDPMNQPASPGVSEGRLGKFDVIKLPADWGQRPLFIRLVMESGQRTDSVRLWREPPPTSQPVE